MPFLLVKSNMFAKFYQIWTKNKKVGVANFCANLMLKMFFAESLVLELTKKIQLKPCFYLLQFPRYEALKIRNWGRGYAFVSGASLSQKNFFAFNSELVAAKQFLRRLQKIIINKKVGVANLQHMGVATSKKFRKSAQS